MTYFNKDIPDMKINLIDTNYILKKTPKSNFSEDILFCPSQPSGVFTSTDKFYKT